MHNFYALEMEAERRQQESLRTAAADARAAQVRPANRNSNRNGRWLGFASRSLPNLPVLALPRVPVGAPLELRRVPRPVEC